MLKRRVSSNEVDEVGNGNGSYRSYRSGSPPDDSSLPIFVPLASDCGKSTSPGVSPYLRRRASSATTPLSHSRQRSYSRNDKFSICSCCCMLSKYACITAAIIFFFYSALHYDEVIPYAKESIATKSLSTPPWLKNVGKPWTRAEELAASQQENERLTLDLENLQAEIQRANTLAANLKQENEQARHAIALLRDQNDEHQKEKDNQEARTGRDVQEEVAALRNAIQKISRHEVLQRYVLRNIVLFIFLRSGLEILLTCLWFPGSFIIPFSFVLSLALTLLNRYGPEPHRVKFSLKFSPMALSAPDGSNPATFVIELAPMDLMPHAVYTFLQMVDNGLWLEVSHDEDGQVKHTAAAEFRQIADHVIVAQPRAEALKKFISSHGIPSMSFPEYTKEYDHLPYTIGFSRKHPGPSFYISTKDNRINHDGDPCFGKIIEGFDTVDRMMNQPRIGSSLDPPVEIVSVGWA